MINREHNNHLNDTPSNKRDEDASFQLEKDKELDLTGNLIEKEAAIRKTDKAVKENEKDIKNIEKSNTWKYTKPIQKLNGIFSKSTKQQDEYIAQLEEKLEKTQQALYGAHEQINQLTLDDRKLDSAKLVETATVKKDEGKLISFIDDVIQQKKAHEANYNRVLQYAARVFMNEKAAYRNLIYSDILAGLKMEDIPEFMVRAGLDDEDSISLRAAVSFRASLNMRMRQKQLVGTLPEWALDNKATAYSFADKLGLRKPWTPDKTYTMANLPEKEGIVIKPADGAGSRGVYLVYSFNDIVDMKRSKKIDSWDLLQASMKQDIDSGWVNNDQWTIEELIYENEKTPARDIKFYCFYGKVGLILEIVRIPEVKYCWWTVTGERVRTGKYDEDLFKGTGVSQSEIDLASDISLKIPAPFIRIDFLKTMNGLVFGEFTPKPGNYDEFDEPTDKWLGDYFAEAQGRLMNDLLQGKQFNQISGVRPDNNY